MLYLVYICDVGSVHENITLSLQRSRGKKARPTTEHTGAWTKRAAPAFACGLIDSYFQREDSPADFRPRPALYIAGNTLLRQQERNGAKPVPQANTKEMNPWRKVTESV